MTTGANTVIATTPPKVHGAAVSSLPVAADIVSCGHRVQTIVQSNPVADKTILGLRLARPFSLRHTNAGFDCAPRLCTLLASTTLIAAIEVE